MYILAMKCTCNFAFHAWPVFRMLLHTSKCAIKLDYNFLLNTSFLGMIEQCGTYNSVK
jgi:hypothetical protein